ncbi:hypothetical protein PC116_g12111 [Phytophthora cactorum]|uniref:Uncharacterized protein n=1 Tax=Phytophthora cactorum TaxID=29920 RepID=A0A8T1BS52_9STRA|nr:hypothetical protein PC117_g20065 [Phytophthora cactorum]KAG4239913.1 hypothetical protein PC116_g12111 [Phytophthora cactorum]
MVYSPSTYLVSAAVATVALQMQQASAASLFYEPITVSDKVNKSAVASLVLVPMSPKRTARSKSRLTPHFLISQLFRPSR